MKVCVRTQKAGLHHVHYNKSLIYFWACTLSSIQHFCSVCAHLPTDQRCEVVSSNLMPGFCFFSHISSGTKSKCQHFPADRTKNNLTEGTIITCLHSFPLCLCSNGGATSHGDQQGGPGVTLVSFSSKLAAVGHIWLVAYDSCNDTWEVRTPLLSCWHQPVETERSQHL